mmetsp:Transcript_75398/g.104727  ORF Transcript_75398/g.104727 Transcript_75398/m.104727 type:complete len:311 (-) Transcript_75398:77-1009(-)
MAPLKRLVSCIVVSLPLAVLTQSDSQCAMQLSHTVLNNKTNKSDAEDFVNKMVQQVLNYPAPAVNSEVSVSRPLLFMHQYRAGGTTLRQLLYNVSVNTGVKAHIACSGGVDCREFQIREASSAVYGGHFCWHESLMHLGEDKKPSCLTNFREPEARLMSCYTHRLVTTKKVAPWCMGKLAPEKLRSMLVNYGCVNEPFRRLGQCGLISKVGDKDRLTRMQVWNATLETLGQCVPILVDEHDTFKAAVNTFPQFKTAFWALKNLTMNQNKYAHDCQISDAHRQVIKELAGPEAMLYAAAKQRALRIQEHFH